MLAIVNAAASAYRGVIPVDRWREPYMPADELEHEIVGGVVFWVAEEEGRVCGVMGIQDRGEVALVRHAYVAPTSQRSGIGSRLLRHVEGLVDKPLLVGTGRPPRGPLSSISETDSLSSRAAIKTACSSHTGRSP